MPKTSKTTASATVKAEGYEGYQEKLEGGYFVSIERYTSDFDLTPFFKGLADDRCICEHWGYVLSGTITYKTARGEETFAAGDAFYVAPGHTHVLTKGGEMVEFSRTAEHDRVAEVVRKNMEAEGHRVTGVA
jgi:hypothetical protein